MSLEIRARQLYTAEKARRFWRGSTVTLRCHAPVKDSRITPHRDMPWADTGRAVSPASFFTIAVPVWVRPNHEFHRSLSFISPNGRQNPPLGPVLAPCCGCPVRNGSVVGFGGYGRCLVRYGSTF